MIFLELYPGDVDTLFALEVPYSIAGYAEPRLPNIKILLFNGIETTHFARFSFSD